MTKGTAVVVGLLLASAGPAAPACLPAGREPARDRLAAERLEAWALATVREELGFRMAELERLQAALGALERAGAAPTPDLRRRRLALQRRLMEGFWAVNRLQRELILLAPRELSPDRPEPEAVVAPQLRPLLDEIALETVSAEPVAHERFTREAASALLDALEREPDSARRIEAARAFYLLFYDVRGEREAVREYLLEAGVRARLARLFRDGQGEVRRSLAQFGQVLLFAFDGPEAEGLAAAYLPALVEGLDDPDPELRWEFLVALDNASGTDAFDAPALREALDLRQARESDPELRDALASLLAKGGGRP